MARLFVVPRLFLVDKRAGDRRRVMRTSSELAPGGGRTATTRKQDRLRYFSAKNQPPLPAA
jgi:hypothetical protein